MGDSLGVDWCFFVVIGLILSFWFVWGVGLLRLWLLLR